MSYALQSSLPKKRTTVVKLNDNATAQIIKMQTNVNNWTQASVQNALREVTLKVLEAQLRIGNEPSEIVTDGTATKDPRLATKSVYIRFGQRINKAVIRQIEQTLERNIRKTTDAFTFTLQNVRQNWTWVLYDRNTKARAKPVNPYSSSFAQFKPGQVLLLIPKAVINEKGENYGSAVNKRIAKREGYGFLARTTKSLNRSSKFRNFYYARVGMSKRFQETNEVRKYGTSYISITPRLRFSRKDIRGRR